MTEAMMTAWIEQAQHGSTTAEKFLRAVIRHSADKAPMDDVLAMAGLVLEQYRRDICKQNERN